MNTIAGTATPTALCYHALDRKGAPAEVLSAECHNSGHEQAHKWRHSDQPSRNVVAFFLTTVVQK
jgi:hypothetical protein